MLGPGRRQHKLRWAMECESRAGTGGLGSSCEDQQLGRGRLKCSACPLGYAELGQQPHQTNASSRNNTLG